MWDGFAESWKTARVLLLTLLHFRLVVRWFSVIDSEQIKLKETGLGFFLVVFGARAGILRMVCLFLVHVYSLINNIRKHFHFWLIYSNIPPNRAMLLKINHHSLIRWITFLSASLTSLLLFWLPLLTYFQTLFRISLVVFFWLVRWIYFRECLEK